MISLIFLQPCRQQCCELSSHGAQLHGQGRLCDWAYECNVRYASMTKNRQLLLFLLHHNLPTNCTNTAKYLSLMQNLVEIRMQFTELGDYIYN